jgi:hypothetical protein
MDRIHSVGLGTLGLALAILAGQPETISAQVGEKLSTVPVVQAAAPSPTTPPTAPPMGTSAIAVRLQADGSLAGQVNAAIGPNGAFQTVQAQISIVKNGQIVAATRTDEAGHFQLVGVQPGIYSLIANGPNTYSSLVTNGPNGYAAFKIQVLPFAGGTNITGDVTNVGTLLYVDLVPTGDFNLLVQTLGATPAAAPSIPTAGTPESAPAGGGGGGAGGLGAALGAGAAAAGLAGGAAGAAGGAPASQSAP